LELNKMKAYTVFNNPEKAQKTISSMVKNSLNITAIMYQPHGDIGRGVVAVDKEYTGNTGRHLDLLELFEIGKLDRPEDNEWVIYSDGHDVRMQRPLPDLPDVEVLVSDEGKTIGENEYWNNLYLEDYFGWQVMNAGLFAMKGRRFLKYLFFVRQMFKDIVAFGYGDSLTDEAKKQAIKLFREHSDTLIFNLFLHRERPNYINFPAFACIAYQEELGLIHRKEDGLWYTKENELISLVHYNGVTKEQLHD
jgi:hypothetical protein